MDAPRQNGQLTIRGKIQVTRSKSSFAAGGISVLCATKEPDASATWRVVHRKRLSIDQFSREDATGKSTVIPFTYIHILGSLCVTGNHQVKCMIHALERLTDKLAINELTGCPDHSHLSCNLHGASCGSDMFDVADTSFKCSESMYSADKSRALPVPPRSVLQHQKVGFLLGGTNIHVNPSFNVNSKENLQTQLEKLAAVKSVAVKNFSYNSEVYVDVALGQNGGASFTSLKDGLSSIRGPVEDVAIRTKAFTASALEKGWWSVQLLRKPADYPGSEYKDFRVHLVLDESNNESLSVMLTKDFEITSNVPDVGAGVYDCSFDNSSGYVPLNSIDKTPQLWTKSPFSLRSYTPEGTGAYFNFAKNIFF